MSDQMPDEVLIDRRMHAWRPEDWHLLDRREGQVRYVQGVLFDAKPCPHVVGETTQHCTLAQEEVQRLTQRAEQAEATLAEMCDKAERFVQRAEKAEADRDTLGYHLERTQERARELESKVTAKVADLSALARWAVDLEAERDRLRAALEAIRDIDTDWTQGVGENMWRAQRIAEEALDHD